MNAMTEVRTSLGRLHVQRSGSGPTVVLWHSLFLDSRTWGPLVEELRPSRTVIMIDGPSHGRSEPVNRDFSYDECTRAAAEALDQLRIDDPVDWLGNAWGGHVGILLAATQPHRIRTLTTIGTPVPGLSLRLRVTQGWPLVALYRLAGPTKFLCRELSHALFGPDATESDMDAFRAADRNGMYYATRSMMLGRPDLHAWLPDVVAPTLMLAAHDDKEGWPPHQAQAVCAAMSNARAGVVRGGGRVSPLLVDPKTIARTLADFWSEVGE